MSALSTVGVELSRMRRVSRNCFVRASARSADEDSRAISTRSLSLSFLTTISAWNPPISAALPLPTSRTQHARNCFSSEVHVVREIIASARTGAHAMMKGFSSERENLSAVRRVGSSQRIGPARVAIL